MAAGRKATVNDRASDAPLPIPRELLDAPGYAARRLYQAYLAAWVRMVDPTMTGPQFAVLTAADNFPGADQGSLAQVAALDRSTMADVVRRLEERGLVVRHPAMNDGRRKLLHLTDEGERQLREVNRRARQLDVKLLRGYRSAEYRRLIEELNQLAERWEGLT
jgi:MarR family transcriptional regulator, temperature-dependent positive regulator of motility